MIAGDYLSKVDMNMQLTKSSQNLPKSEIRSSILVIEQEKEIISNLKSHLSDSYNLTILHNGQSGIVKALELIPNLVISGINLRGVNGYSVCRKLKSDHRSIHIPIILISLGLILQTTKLG